MEVPNYCYIFTLLCVLVSSVVSNKQCGPGVTTLGFTLPKGDIQILYGQPLEIYCTLNSDAINGHEYNSSSLYFSYDNEPIESDYITVINGSTIRLYIQRPPRWKKLIQCNLRQEDGSALVVCLNYVFVGDKPQKLLNFDCISYNWETLNCSWTRKPNYIPTRYNVSFASQKTNINYHFPCPGSTEKNYCVWRADTKPVYRPALPYFYFSIQGKNVFGEIVQNVTINNFASILPNKPVHLSVVESTSESLTITWAVPLMLRSFHEGLDHKILYQSKYDNTNVWQTIYLKPAHPKNDTFSKIENAKVQVYNITNLKYPHTLYDIRVMIKPFVGDEKKWSEPATTTFHTNATIPAAPPKTVQGGFEVRYSTNGVRDVYIYWQQIPNFMENGDNFEYKVTKIVEHTRDGPKISNLTPSLVTKTYAKFRNLAYNRYDFTIISSNNMGYSRDASHITVPEKEKSLPEPAHFVKSFYGHGFWELNWKLDPSVWSYTIFWCDNRQDRPYECKGYLNWTQVYVGRDINGETATVNMTLPVDKVYQIALSANTDTSSSGMVWASCTLFSDQVTNKFKNIWISKIGSDFMEVNWIFDCIRVHEGFQLLYCPIKDPEMPKCKEPAKSISIKGNAVDSHAVIRDLKPYTTYSVSFQTAKNVPLSKVLYNTTLEAAPDESPRHLKGTNITNSSVTLTWERPASLNGVLRHYILYWNFNSTKIENQSSVVQYTLRNLRSYNDYFVKLQACTTACSPNSTIIDFKTKTGVPGQVEAPTVRFINKTIYNMVVSWNSPKEPGGIIDHYIVRVNLSDENSVNLKSRNYSSKGLTLTIPTRECQTDGAARIYKVEISPVTIDENGVELNGLWSVPGEKNCVPSFVRLSFPMILLIFVVGILATFAICISLVYIIRYVWLRCKAMQNVGVKLPPQLELSSVFKEKGTMDLQMASHVCPPQLKTLDVKDIPPPDQQLLLDKKDKEESLESSTEDCEEGGGDQESSGCGSGHDSVSSSITAGTHITDSGTEADERPSTPDVFGETPRRKTDNRSRNVSLSGSGGEGYSRLAAAPSNNGSYVTVAPASRGYVSHPPLWPQNPSKGYVTVGPPVNLNSNCD